MKQLIYIALLSLTLFSCEREIPIHEEEYESYVVVNSVITSESTWLVKLHYSKSIFDRGDFKPVENAIVHISVLDDLGPDSREIQEFYLDDEGNGNYTRGNNPTEGRNYKMTIEVDGEVICAETYVPRVLEASIGTKTSLVDTITNTVSHSVSIDIEEHLNEDNFYTWELLAAVEDPISEETTNENGTATGKDGEILSVDTDGPQPNTNQGPLVTSIADLNTRVGLSTVNPVNGTTEGVIIANISTIAIDNEITKETDDQNPQNIASDPPKKKYLLHVSAISKEYYNYLISIQHNGLSSSEGAYLNYYSNVNNGGGIFAGYSQKVFEVEL